MIGGFDPTNFDPKLQLLDLDRCDCEDSLYIFLKSAWHIFDSAPWVDGWCIEAIAEHLQAVVDGQIKRLIINIPPRCSKPLAHDSLTSTRRGLIPLADVRVGDEVLTHRGRWKAVLEVHKQGILPVVKVKTTRGREVVAAGDHPFLTPQGWQEIGKINPNDILGTIPQYLHSGVDTMSAECARLLGYLIGDGDCKRQPRITVADELEAADIRLCAISCGLTPSDKIYKLTANKIPLRVISLTAKESHKHSRKLGSVGPARKFVDSYGLGAHDSYTKMVPSQVMIGSDEIVKNFIGAYWACDGFVTTRGAKRDGTERVDLLIGCDSVNLNFLHQMQALLLRIGVSSTIRKKISKIKTKIQGDEYISYSLTLSDQDNCWRFASSIKIFHSKGEKLESARKRRFDFDQTIRGEVVESICPFGQAECICLTVEDDESFVANGFAVHNSAFTSVGLAPWTWAQRRHTHTSGPGVSFLYASFREDLSKRDSINSRRIIESRWYQERWGKRFELSDDQNTKARYNNSEGGYRLITSIESKGATGDGGNIIVLDDCNSAKEVESEAIIESTLEWFDGTLGTRLNNQKLGAVIEIQQRLGENDITGHILSKSSGDWVHLCLPMRFEKDRSFVTVIGWEDPRTEEGELLWPERFGEAEVAGLETWLGPWRSAGQLQQRPEPRGGGIIKTDWWRLWKGDAFPAMDYKIGCLDTAYTLKEQNDPSGMIVWGVFSGDRNEQSVRMLDSEGNLTYTDPTFREDSTQVMLMNAWTDRYEFHELIKKVVKTAVEMKIDLLMIENKAAGISVAQEIRRLYADERFGVMLFDPKSQDKFARLVSVQHLFQEGLIFAPDRKWADEVIKQCAQFPRGKHDEYVDMTSMGLRHLRDGGLLRRAPEQSAAYESLKEYSNRNIEPLYSV